MTKLQMVNSLNSISLNGQSFTPSKIVCIGRNFVDHITELGNEVSSSPVIFVKPNSAISSTLTKIPDELVHFETEISYLIKNGQLHAVGIGLDLTKRDLQNELKSRGLPWERAKAFDGSALFSEFVAISNKDALYSLELFIDGHLRQKGDISLMLYKPNKVLEEIKSFMSLADYDIIMTGTPSGVGAFEKGQSFVARLFADDKQVLEKQWLVE